MTEKFVVSPRLLCEQMRARGVPDAIAKYKTGTDFIWVPKRARIARAIFLRHDEKFPIAHWDRLRPEDRQRLPRHQWPVDPDSQAS